MSTTGASNLAQDLYDPDDDVLPRDSPLLKPIRPQLRLTPSPPPSIPYPRVKPSQGDAVLVGFLDGGRRPEIAITAGNQPLPSDFEDDSSVSGESDSTVDHIFSSTRRTTRGQADVDPDGSSRGDFSDERMGLDSPTGTDIGPFDLKSLATNALKAFAAPEPRPEPIDPAPAPTVARDEQSYRPPSGLVPPAISIRRGEPVVDGRLAHTEMPSPYSPRSLGIYSPLEPGGMLRAPSMDMKSPINGMSPGSHVEGLPPIQLHTPRSETNGHTPLPSIRSTLGDLDQLASNHAVETAAFRTSHQPGFPQSPPGTLLRLSSMHPVQHASPPISPTDTFRASREPLSPGQTSVTGPSPGYYPYPPGSAPGSATFHRSPHGYSTGTAETPGSDQSGSTPATLIADRMSIDGLTTTQGTYTCEYPGCTAQPFQTQYLLSSHQNVHSSARPHYCSVPNCPRSEGGKGFKRKNEMIRHGLVHESPGYVCPFCPDREHKYPRPDNLQRHVRVHHVDKDKDDAQLRDVLAQRPGGPNRGRRRRGAL